MSLFSIQIRWGRPPQECRNQGWVVRCGASPKNTQASGLEKLLVFVPPAGGAVRLHPQRVSFAQPSHSALSLSAKIKLELRGGGCGGGSIST